MNKTTLRLVLVAASALAAAAPAALSAQPDGQLGCAVRQVPEDARANLRRTYEASGLDVSAEQLIPRPVVDRIATCIEQGAADREERLSRLVAGVMAYEMMVMAQDLLGSRHAIAMPALESVWTTVSAEERRALLPPEEGQEETRVRPAADVVVRIAGVLRPGLTRETLGAPANSRLLADLIVYSVSRAVVEDMSAREAGR